MFSLISSTFMAFGFIGYTFAVHSGKDSILAKMMCLVLIGISILLSVVQECSCLQDIDKLTRRVQELEEKIEKEDGH